MSNLHASLVGRARETELLDGLVAGVRERGGALLVRGDAGIGKSALLSAASRTARLRSMRVLTTAGVESAAHRPFAGLHELLRPILGDIETLPARQREALNAAFGIADGGAPDVFLIALAALTLLGEAASETPTLVAIDDAHLLDRSSADVLAFVARRLESEPIVLLVAIRDGFEGPLSQAGLAELRVDALDDAAAASLLDATAPKLTAAVRARLLAAAAGNPLALIELPVGAERDHDRGSLPAAWPPITERLERAFAARLPGLPTATRALLLVAALNDGELSSETLDAAAVVLGAPVTVDDCTPAISVRLVEADDKGLRFRHPLVCSAIQQGASLAQRYAAHAALADVLAVENERRVWHLAASSWRPDEGIASELELEAARAQRRGGTLTAVAALERAAEISKSPALRVPRLLRAAELAVELGQQELVNRLLRAVEPLELSAPQRAQLIWISGRLDDGVREDVTFARSLTGLAQEVAITGDTDLALKLLDRAALHCFWIAGGPEAGNAVIECAERLRVDELDPRLLAILAFANPIDRGAVVLDRLHQFAAADVGDAPTARLLGAAALMVGDFDLARAQYQRAVPDLREQGRLALLARALTALAWSAGHLVDLGVAIPAAEEGSRMAHETHLPIMRATALATEAMLAALRGERDRTDALANEAELASVTVAARPVLTMVQHARGLLALGEGRHVEAYEHLRRMHDPADPAFQFALRCSAFGDFAEAAAYSGNSEAIAVAAAEMEALGAKTPSPALHAGLRHARALLAGDDEKEQLFELALRADTSRRPFVRARAQLAYGSWLRRQRRVADSRAPLRSARDTFDALGVLPWSERARQELRASGETSRRRTPDARDQLTPQELQIAQMAAEGLTNREIGEKLYVSHRTVSAHLHRIFPKLGITARAQLRVSLEAAAAST